MQYIYANVYYQNDVFKIDVESGRVVEQLRGDKLYRRELEEGQLMHD